MTIEDALERLSTNNLNPHLDVLGEDKQIIGYLELQMYEGSVGIGKQYAIYHEGSHWVGAIPGIPYNTIISHSADLADVVDGVCEFYQLRETTPRDGMTLEEAAKLLAEGGLAITLSGVNNDKMWGQAPQRVLTPDGLKSEVFTVHWYVGAWLAAYFTLEKKSRPIKYSRSLGDVAQAVLDFYHERNEV